MTIGHVIPLAGKTEMVNPIFSDFLAGAGEVYAREGYDMLLSVVGPDGAGDAYRQMAANGSVDGVMVQGPQIDDPRVPLLQELGLPFLVHGRTGRPPITAGSTWPMPPPSARRPTSCSISAIGASRSINGQESFDFAARRRAGYEEALTARGIRHRPRAHVLRRDDRGLWLCRRRAMLDAPDPPTAFVVSSIIPAIGVRRAAANGACALAGTSRSSAMTTC
jgi:LacI family transcriptional regulator